MGFLVFANLTIWNKKWNISCCNTFLLILSLLWMFFFSFYLYLSHVFITFGCSYPVLFVLYVILLYPLYKYFCNLVFIFVPFCFFSVNIQFFLSIIIILVILIIYYLTCLQYEFGIRVS